MHILTFITDVRSEEVSRGRSVGQETHFQFAIAGDKYNWILSRIVVDKAGNKLSDIGLKFYSSFGGLFACMMERGRFVGLNPDMFSIQEVFNKVNKVLAKITKKPVFNPEKEITKENCKEIGCELTKYYGVNYCSVEDNPSDGYLAKKLFK